MRHFQNFEKCPANLLPDFDLIDLGIGFEWAASAESELADTSTLEENDMVIATIGDLGEKIEALSATTLKGLQVKAKVVKWCMGETDIMTADFSHFTTEIRMALGLARDILSMEIA